MRNNRESHAVIQKDGLAAGQGVLIADPLDAHSRAVENMTG
ncbi:hypothetical protein GC243_14065, partial [Staphylococcus aureus]|nr:hypothetical protein [Staphylococcus aureus]